MTFNGSPWVRVDSKTGSQQLNVQHAASATASNLDLFLNRCTVSGAASSAQSASALSWSPAAFGATIVEPFSPTQIPDCALWLRADWASMDASSKVARWNDRSPRDSEPVVQTTGAAQPTWAPVGIGGRPVLIFGGAASLAATSGLMSSSEHTYYIVANVASISTNSSTTYANVAILCDGTNGYIGAYLKNGGGSPTISAYVYRSSPSTDYHADQGFSLNTDCIFELRLVDVSGTRTLYAERIATGADNATSLAAYQASGSNAVQIGLGAANAYFNGKLAEIIFYNRAIGDDERTNVVNYLKARYGIS